MQFTVLSKSSKNQNKCVAGVLEDGSLIRIVSDDETTDCAIPNWYLRNSYHNLDIQVLDEIEVSVIGNCPNEIQSENILVDVNQLPVVVGHKSLQDALQYADLNADEYIFGNTCSFLTEQEAMEIGCSLQFVICDNVHIYKNAYGKTRVDFDYNGNRYVGIRVTDRDYYDVIDLQQNNAAILLSLPHNPDPYNMKRYYKFAARIFAFEILASNDLDDIPF